MSDSGQMTALDTIYSLERRLRQLLTLTIGNTEANYIHQMPRLEKDETVLARMAKIEKGLANLAAKAPTFGELLQLYSSHQEMFRHEMSTFPTTTLTTSELLALIDTCATAYPSTASRLISIKDAAVPPMEASVSLISLQPRLSRLKLQQESQARDVKALMSRSASTLQRWYGVGVLGGGECWTEWERRLTEVEKRVRREEAYHDQEVKTDEAYRS